MKNRLTDFNYLQVRTATLSSSGITALVKEYQDQLLKLKGEERAEFEIWAAFFRERAHILSRGNAQWPANRILLQLAIEHADNSPITRAAEEWLKEGNCDWVWLRQAARKEYDVAAG
jgi:hypothetical protein